MDLPKRILICDDEAVIIDILQAQLNDAGHDCLVAREGTEAFEIISENLDIELVITDIVMPGMSGYDLIESLDVTNENLKIIVITGYAMDEKVRKLCDYPNVLAIVAKPWDKHYLMGLVNKHLAKEAPPGELFS